MKLLMHVGLHRAGSTTLQNWLLAERPEWKRRRVFIHARASSGGTPSPFAILSGRSVLASSPEAIAAYLREAMQELARDFAAGIVSDENLLGPMPGPRQPAFRRLRILCDVLQRLCPDTEFVPVVVLRDHRSWLISLYRTYLSRGGTRTFSAFCRATEASKLRFAPLLQQLGTLGRPIVLALEDFSANASNSVCGRITAEFGANPTAAVGHVNRAFSDMHLQITSALGHHHAVLAEHGGTDMVAVARAGAREIARIIEARAVKVSWKASPAMRMNRATALFRRGIPPERRLPAATCLAIAEAALAAGPINLEASQLPLDEFAADRQIVAETWLPQWSTRQ